MSKISNFSNTSHGIINDKKDEYPMLLALIQSILNDIKTLNRYTSKMTRQLTNCLKKSNKKNFEQNKDLQEVKLKDIDLQEVKLKDIDLQEVKLKDIDLQEIKLKDIDLQEIKLNATQLHQDNIIWADDLDSSCNSGESGSFIQGDEQISESQGDG